MKLQIQKKKCCLALFMSKMFIKLELSVGFKGKKTHAFACSTSDLHSTWTKEVTRWLCVYSYMCMCICMCVCVRVKCVFVCVDVIINTTSFIHGVKLKFFKICKQANTSFLAIVLGAFKQILQ